MRTKRNIIVIAAIGSGLLLASAAISLAPASPAHAAAATQHITMGNNFYMPTTITVNAGDTVQWDWPAAPNSTPHTVTSDTGTTLGSPQQATGTYSHTFDAAGVFPFHCEVHPTQMTGTITVQAAAAPTNTAAASSTAAASPTATASVAPTRTATGSVTAVAATSTPVAVTTGVVQPTITTGREPTAAVVGPPIRPAAGTGAARELPGTGTGPAPSGRPRFGWLSLLLALVGVGTFGVVPVAIRRR